MWIFYPHTRAWQSQMRLWYNIGFLCLLLSALVPVEDSLRTADGKHSSEALIPILLASITLGAVRRFVFAPVGARVRSHVKVYWTVPFQILLTVMTAFAKMVVSVLQDLLVQTPRKIRTARE